LLPIKKISIDKLPKS